MDFPLNDFMQKEVCEATGLNPRTVSARLSKFHEMGILVDTRKVGKATFYRLNREDYVVGKIEELVTAISLDTALEEQTRLEPQTAPLASKDAYVER
ncbi:MAG TPA: helix-turn-helix domain-containing protein [Candidatus Krumholzibacteriaceae bacterium]|nr:helix-turn-helix domain-containing protein [Candidatus Krumholzibacteriaceae bacterium]